MTLEELRSYRVLGGIALFDLVFSFIGIICLFIFFRNKWFKNKPLINFVIAGILLTIPIGIVFHVIFGVNTHLNRQLGLSN